MTRNRSIFNRATHEPASSPAWVVTYADLVTLLLCVFVGLFSMSAIRPDRFQTALGSLQETFGSKEFPDASSLTEDSLFRRVQFALKVHDEGCQVVQIPHGVRIVLGGPSVFRRGQADVSETAADSLNRVAAILSGIPLPIIVSGHSAGESNGEGDDPRELSYERATRVARRLEAGGIARPRVQVTAQGEDHPAVDHAYTEKRRAMNRRVEIEIVEGGGSGGAAELATNNQG